MNIESSDEEFKEFSRKVGKILNTSYSEHVTEQDLMEYAEILKREGEDHSKVFTVTREQVDIDIQLI